MLWVLKANTYILLASKMLESGLLNKYLFAIRDSIALILSVSLMLLFLQIFNSESSLIANEKDEIKRVNMNSNRLFMNHECKKKAPILGLFIIILVC